MEEALTPSFLWCVCVYLRESARGNGCEGRGEREGERARARERERACGREKAKKRRSVCVGGGVAWNVLV